MHRAARTGGRVGELVLADHRPARGAVRESVAPYGALAGESQYVMTTRPSIFPCFISSRISLISSRPRFDTVGWMTPRA